MRECDKHGELIRLVEEWDEQPSGEAMLCGKDAVLDFLHMPEVEKLVRNGDRDQQAGTYPSALSSIGGSAIANYIHRLMHSCPTNPEVVKIACELNALLATPSSKAAPDPFEENDVARRLRNFRLDPVLAGQRWEGKALDTTMVEAARLIDRLEKQINDQSMSVLVPMDEYDKMKAALSATFTPDAKLEAAYAALRDACEYFTFEGQSTVGQRLFQYGKHAEVMKAVYGTSDGTAKP